MLGETSIWGVEEGSVYSGLIKYDGLIWNRLKGEGVVDDSWEEKDLLLFLCATIFPV